MSSAYWGSSYRVVVLKWCGEAHWCVLRQIKVCLGNSYNHAWLQWLHKYHKNSTASYKTNILCSISGIFPIRKKQPRAIPDVQSVHLSSIFKAALPFLWWWYGNGGKLVSRTCTFTKYDPCTLQKKVFYSKDWLICLSVEVINITYN